MSAYNDIVRVSDWMHAYQHIPKNELAKKLDDNRRSMQWRFILGTLHESREALKRLKEDAIHFQKLWEALSNDGRATLDELEKLLFRDSEGDALSLARFLNIVRNRGAHHYIHVHFRDGLRQLRKAFGETTDGFILEGTTTRGRLRFSFADTVRNAAAFGADRDLSKLNEELERIIQHVPIIIGLLNRFLQSAFAAQCQLHGHKISQDGHNWMVRPCRPNAH